MKVRSTCKLYVYSIDNKELGYYDLLDNTVNIPLNIKMLAKTMFDGMPSALAKRGYQVSGEGTVSSINDNGRNGYEQILQGYRGILRFKAVTTVREI